MAVGACVGDGVVPAEHTASATDPLLWTKSVALSGQGQSPAFGAAVALSGDWAVVGDPGYGTFESGAAFVFERSASGGWIERKILLAPNPQAGAGFGWSVGLSGDRVVVGAYTDDGFSDNAQGAAYLFERDLGGVGNWGLRRELISNEASPNSGFGWAVGISGDVVIVGAYLDDAPGTHSGAAYLFERNVGGVDQWGERAQLHGAGHAYDWAGWAVGVADDVAIVGAKREDVSPGIVAEDSGAAYVFERDHGGPNAWGLRKRLRASDAAEQRQFGAAVAATAHEVVVGAPGYPNPYFGHAYLFGRDVPAAGGWAEIRKLTPSNSAEGDQFGLSVALSTDRVLVGYAQGRAYAAYVFGRDRQGPGAWGEEQILQPTGPGFARSLSLEGTTALVGAPPGALVFDGVEIGAACAVPSQCPTGFCVDGVCCDSACEGGAGDCQGCSVMAGALVDGRCALLVDESPCDDGGHCNGVEHCSAGNCVGQLGDTCAAVGLVCDEATGACVEGANLIQCDGDHTLQKPDGSSADCSPYRCIGDGTCRGACTATAECAAGNVCDARGRCVWEDSVAVAAPGAGCAIAEPSLRTSSDACLFWAAPLLAGLFGRRRARLR